MNMKPSVMMAWALVVAVLLVVSSVDCTGETGRRIFKRSTNNKSSGSAGAGCTYRFRCKKKVRGIEHFLYPSTHAFSSLYI